jgi:Tfp pilus assembly protein FimT
MVMAIMVILAAIAVPRYARALTNYRGDAAVRRVVADIAFARAQARISSASRTITFRVALDEYEVSDTTATGAAGSGAYVVQLDDEPYGVDLLTASFGGVATLTFDSYGQPTAGGTLTLRAGDRTRTVTVAASGEVTTQ